MVDKNRENAFSDRIKDKSIIKPAEILAPVGNFAMYMAAKKAGVDAVYLAAKVFGARAYANNFDLEEISEICKDAHLNSIKVYAAVNILIKDGELKEALKLVENLYRSGVDALIIQDIGLYSLIKDIDDIEIHASTQMSIYNFESAKFASELGFNRIVIGRETPIEEIKRITDYGIEVEAFVHGSLCVSVSGQCLISSLIGGRSGNRGACAQICRKDYTLISNGKKFKGQLISPRDLSTIDRSQELLKAGISSFKIEGRMKKPEYVYTVSDNYSKAVKGESYKSDLLPVVSNRAFTEGYIFAAFGENYLNDPSDKGLLIGKIKGEKRKHILLSTPVYKGDTLLVPLKNKNVNITLTKDYKVFDKINLEKFPDAINDSSVKKIYSEKIQEEIEKLEEKKFPLSFKFSINSQKAVLLASYEKTSVQIEENSDKARNIALSDDLIKRQLNKLNETQFYLDSLEILNSNDAFLTVSTINSMRRRAVSEIMTKMIRNRSISLDDKIREIEKRKKVSLNKTDRFLSLEICGNYREDGYKNLHLVRRVYTNNLDDVIGLKAKVEEVYYKPNRLNMTSDYERIEKELKPILKYIDGFSCNNFSDLYFFKRYKKKIHLENSFNIINSQSLKFMAKFADSISISQELTLDELSGIKGEYETIVYGKIPAMLMRHCPFSPIKKCGGVGCEKCNYRNGILKNGIDEFEYRRKYKCDYKYTELFYKAIDSVYLCEKFPTNARGLRIVILDEDNPDEIIKNYHNAFIKNEGQGNPKIRPDNKIDNCEDKYTGHYEMGLKV